MCHKCICNYTYLTIYICIYQQVECENTWKRFVYKRNNEQLIERRKERKKGVETARNDGHAIRYKLKLNLFKYVHTLVSVCVCEERTSWQKCLICCDARVRERRIKTKSTI